MGSSFVSTLQLMRDARDNHVDHVESQGTMISVGGGGMRSLNERVPESSGPY